MIGTDKFYIGGSWVDPSSTEVIDVVNPSTGAAFATVPQGTAADVDAAVAAAKNAFDSWSQTELSERRRFVSEICNALEANAEALTDLIVSELGMPVPATQQMQVGLAIAEARHHVELAENFAFEETIQNSIIVREPVGVVAAITPWNYPLVQVMRKVAPALVTGCTIVIKPSEETPLNAYFLADIIDKVGLPAGVFNLITGYGEVVGEALAAHPDVDLISLTGSTRAGRRVSVLASETIKRVALELGGKSANVVLDDADMKSAVDATLGWVYLNTGQTCSALTRLLVPRSRLQEAEALLVEATKSVKVGDPREAGTTMGPVVSRRQRERVLGYVQKGVDEGARLLVGGADVPDSTDSGGFYVQPTIFTDVKPGMAIEQEEIFGPVLVVVPYDTEDEAVAIANGTIYGLAAAVSSTDPARARSVAGRLRAGQIEINGGDFNPYAPFGGYKQSGTGRENGHFGFEEFLEIKSLQL